MNERLDMMTSFDTAPRRVFLFSGHMMDAPERATPRFPASLETAAAREIGSALDAWDAGAQDLALSQAAAGGDILFLEACRQRQVRCRILLPFPVAEFIEQSILPSTHGHAWLARFHALEAASPDAIQVMPSGSGDPFERCNLWLLDTALALGADKLHFLCLWDGHGGDGPGGTAHLFKVAQQRAAQARWIDTRLLT